MQLSLCWAYQRRDFLRVANDHPAPWAWAAQWAQHVGQLHALHHSRRQQMAEPTSAAFTQSDAVLRKHLLRLQQRCDEQLAVGIALSHHAVSAYIAVQTPSVTSVPVAGRIIARRAAITIRLIGSLAGGPISSKSLPDLVRTSRPGRSMDAIPVMTRQVYPFSKKPAKISTPSKFTTRH